MSAQILRKPNSVINFQLTRTLLQMRPKRTSAYNLQNHIICQLRQDFNKILRTLKLGQIANIQNRSKAVISLFQTRKLVKANPVRYNRNSIHAESELFTYQ